MSDQSVAARIKQFKREMPLPESGKATLAWKDLRADSEFWEDLLDAIVSGSSVLYFARQKVIKPSLLHAWLARLPEGSDKKLEYEAARKARAEYMADRILEQIDQVGTGKVSPPQARVIIDALRWMAARLDPQIWGDKLQIEAKVQTTTELHLIAVKEMAEQVKVLGHIAIEGEYIDVDELLS